MRCQGSDRGEVLSNGIRTKGSGSPPSSGDAGWLQKTNRRGKAPYCVAASGDEDLVSTCRKCGQVRFAKDPAPASRRPGKRHRMPEAWSVLGEKGPLADRQGLR